VTLDEAKCYMGTRYVLHKQYQPVLHHSVYALVNVSDTFMRVRHRMRHEVSFSQAVDNERARLRLAFESLVHAGLAPGDAIWFGASRVTESAYKAFQPGHARKIHCEEKGDLDSVRKRSYVLSASLAAAETGAPDASLPASSFIAANASRV